MTTYVETTVNEHTIALASDIRSVGALTLSEDPADIAWLYHLVVNDEWRDYYVVYVGPTTSDRLPLLPSVSMHTPMPVRIDSGCITGMTFGDKSCECKDQLDAAIQLIRSNGQGFVIHVPSQDGRGMGIDFKLKTLNKQLLEGQDTVQAARDTAGSHLIDRRTYHGAIACLKVLGIDATHALNIATNNPDKIAAFRNGGLTIAEETRIHIKPTMLTERHLQAKKEHLNHSL
jgi:GTP cyclohydrolase II